MMIQIIFLSFFTSIIASTVSNPGSCPKIPPNTAGICIQGCNTDADCRKWQKCCSNGCGNVCTNVTSVECTQVACKCRFGTIFFKDENGCDSCTCKEDPCATVRCASGTVCQVNPADNTASCVPNCSQVMCLMYCEYGFEYDNTGCPICKCLDPCAKCSSDQICTIKNNTCKPYSSSCQPYIGVCTPKCGPVCAIFCQYGNVYDDRGCPTCRCSPDPCDNVKCGFNQVCTRQKSTCSPYSSTCSVYTGVCLRRCNDISKCNLKCRYGLFYDVWGCPQCRCLSDPCASVLCPPWKTCRPQKSACETFNIACQPYVGVCS